MMLRDMLFDRADSEMSFWMAENAEAGIIVCYPTGSGVIPSALDHYDNVAVVPTSDTEVPIGILMDNVKDLPDQRYLPNETMREALFNVNHPHGSLAKIEIIRAGWFSTDMIDTGSVPVPGDPAYFMAGGLFTTDTGSARVGTFESEKDENGFARIRINL
jgi:hypothetical protein